MNVYERELTWQVLVSFCSRKIEYSLKRTDLEVWMSSKITSYLYEYFTKPKGPASSTVGLYLIVIQKKNNNNNNEFSYIHSYTGNYPD